MDVVYALLTFVDNVAVQTLLAFPLLASLVLSYRCLRVPDVTIDGSSVFAAAVSVLLATRLGVDPILSLLVAAASGFLAGLITGVLVECFKINALLAGILNAFVFYSLALLLVGAVLDYHAAGNIFTFFKATDLSLSRRLPSTLIVHPTLLLFLAILAASLVFAMDWLLRREWGAILRASGTNDLFVQLLGVNGMRVRVLGFGLANALVGFGATLISMYEGGVQAMRWPGTVIFALSVGIMGWELARQLRSHLRVPLGDTSALLLGGAVYYSIVRVCYSFNIPTALPRLVIASYIIAVLAEKAGVWRRLRELMA